jgi:catechol 2,3-dioxygenase
LVRVELRVRDLDRVVEYYRDALGFEVVATEGTATSLRLGGNLFALDLVHAPEAPLRPYPCVGLYHFALVVPDRAALGAVFSHLIGRQEAFEGMSDHGVSESLYLRDPEQNGIEIYRDRPKDEWPLDPGGQFAMVSDPLDVDGVLRSADEPSPLHAETRFGHVHLHVPSLEGAEAFYAGKLGLGVTQRTYFGALFLAAGDYHHHVGANTWAPERVVPQDATGLVGYTWRIPGAADRPGPLVDPAGAEVRFEVS